MCAGVCVSFLILIVIMGSGGETLEAAQASKPGLYPGGPKGASGMSWVGHAKPSDTPPSGWADMQPSSGEERSESKQVAAAEGQRHAQAQRGSERLVRSTPVLDPAAL